MKGLSFNEPMVKAWMEGRRPAARVLIKNLANWSFSHKGLHNDHCFVLKNSDGSIFDSRWISPRYLPGETVYIKETWKPDNHFKGGGIPRLGITFGEGCQWKTGNPDQSGPWKSPAIMPEIFARSHAKIISVRPERENGKWAWRIELEKIP